MSAEPDFPTSRYPNGDDVRCAWCHKEFDHANRDDDSDLCRNCDDIFIRLYERATR